MNDPDEVKRDLERLVETLRKNNKGRATCLILGDVDKFSAAQLHDLHVSGAVIVSTQAPEAQPPEAWPAHLDLKYDKQPTPEPKRNDRPWPERGRK